MEIRLPSLLSFRANPESYMLKEKLSYHGFMHPRYLYSYVFLLVENITVGDIARLNQNH